MRALALRRWAGPWSALLLLLLVKLAAASYFVQLTDCLTPGFRRGLLALEAGDTQSYLAPIENYLEAGRYFWFNGRNEVQAGRMPYYGLPYLLLRLWLAPSSARDALVAAQIVTECVASMAVAGLAFSLSRSVVARGAAYILLLLSMAWTQYSYRLLPESFALSSLSLFLVLYEKYHRERRDSQLLWAGLALAVSALLKLQLLLLFVAVVLDLARDRNRNLPSSGQHALWAMLRKAVLLVAPLIALLAPWTARNYLVYQRFVPLQIDSSAGYDFDATDFAYRDFLAAWGGSAVWWDKRTAGCYFEPRPGFGCEFTVAERVFAPGYGRADVAKLRDLFIESRSKPELRPVVRDEFNRLTSLYRTGRPLDYYFFSRIGLSLQLVVHSGSYYLPILRGTACFRTYQLVLKALQSLLYWVTLVTGFAGLMLFTYRGRLPPIHIALPLLLLFLFGWVIRIPEARYFDLAHPVLVLGTAMLAGALGDRVRARR